MARKSVVLIPVIAAATVVGILGITFVPPEIRERDAGFPKGTVRIGDKDVLTVEIAETPAERQRWMTFRQDHLPLDTAMLIKYDTLDLHEVWMMNVGYNLDLIWFDRDGNSIYLIKNAAPCENVVETVSCTYKPTKQALYVMAGTAGFIEAHGITVGSKMTIISA